MLSHLGAMRLPLTLALTALPALLPSCSVSEGGPASSPAAPVVHVSEQASATTPAGAAAKGAPAFLVWARDAKGEATTYRVDAAGHAIDHVPGIRVATSRGELAFTKTGYDVPTEACDFGDPEGPFHTPGTGHAVRATLESPSLSEPIALDGAGATSDANEVGHDVTVMASLGPLLFLEEELYLYACGAHGSSSKTFIVWDAERGAPVTGALENIPDIGTLVSTASGHLYGDADGNGDGPSPDVSPSDAEGAPAITEMIPVFAGGRVRFEAQLTIPTCYACSDGLWDSYTRSVRLPARPPAALEVAAGTASGAALPEGVRAFLSRNPTLVPGGFSTVHFDMGALANPSLDRVVKGRHAIAHGE